MSRTSDIENQLMTIWKFPLKVTPDQGVLMPTGAQVLSVGLDPDGLLCAWALVDPNAAVAIVPFAILGTGHAMTVEFASQLRHLGSVTMGAYVWHVFTRA